MEKRLIRIKFSKMGEIKYISHLDLGRTFMRALRRARVPLWYSEGFTPHPKLNFALPLSVGAESECELCDISVPADAPEGCMAPLAEELPAGLTLLEITENPERKFSAVEYAAYRLEFPDGAVAADALRERLSRPMPVTKHSKKGEVELDVAPMLSDVEIRAEGEDLTLSVLLPAGGEAGYLNPEMILKALEGEELFRSLCENCRIVRTALYDGNKELF